MATVSDFPFDPVANPTWNDVLTSAVPGFGAQTYSPVLDNVKVDSSITIQPLLIPQQIGAVWSNTVDTYMRVSWPAIVSVLTGAGSDSFLSLTDTPGSYATQGTKLLRVNAAETSIEFVPDIPASQVTDGVTDGDGTKRFLNETYTDNEVFAREPTHTGVITWNSPGISLFDATTITVEAGTGVQVTQGSELSTTAVQFSWAQQNVVISAISSRGGTFITVDTAGNVQQYVSFPSQAVLDSEAFLGVVIHDGASLDRVVTAPVVSGGAYQLLRDEISASGPVKLTAGGDVSERSTFQAIAGIADVFTAGINFVNSSSDPNTASYPAEDPMLFNYVFEDGTVSVADTSVFTKEFESAPGVLTSLSGQQAVIHKIILLADGSHLVQYGDTAYSNFATAKNNITDDILNTTFNPLSQFMGILLAVAVVGNQPSDWAVDAAEIILVSGGAGGGGGGGATPALGQLTDVTLSSVTEGQVISFDGTDTWNNGSLPAQFIFTLEGNTAPGTDVAPRTYVFATKFFPTNVRIDVKSAPTTTSIQVDVLSNGVTIFSGGGPVIGIGQFTAQKVPLTAALVNGDSLTININTGDANWQDLTVSLQGHPIPG